MIPSRDVPGLTVGGGCGGVEAGMSHRGPPILAVIAFGRVESKTVQQHPGVTLCGKGGKPIEHSARDTLPDRHSCDVG